METIKVQITNATRHRPAQLVCRFKKTTHRLPVPETNLLKEQRGEVWKFAKTIINDFNNANPKAHALELGDCTEHTRFYLVHAPYEERFVFQVSIA
jgi:hypothetical protein